MVEPQATAGATRHQQRIDDLCAASIRALSGQAGLHFRGAPAEAAAAAALAHSLAAGTGLALQAGNQVLELKTPGTDKGAALTAFMAEAPFSGAVPVMVGDDLTDVLGDFRGAGSVLSVAAHADNGDLVGGGAIGDRPPEGAQRMRRNRSEVQK